MSQDSQNSLITNTESDPSQSEEKFVKLYRLPSDELLTSQVKQRMDVIQSLTEPCDRKTYAIRKKEAAQKLGVSIRQVERLLKKWREERLVGLTTTRSDKGKYRIDQEWIDFIIDTFKKGNEGSKRMTRHQVFLRVKGRAKQLNLNKEEYPSYQSVYRILDEYIEQKQRKLKARSPGMLGERLTHMTRDRRELEVECSNDVWQCDHTR
ncbi:MAG: helix-turn-helix domain-containing protein, partial [Hassallia sp.]